jgi:hypothetical protein
MTLLSGEMWNIKTNGMGDYEEIGEVEPGFPLNGAEHERDGV